MTNNISNFDINEMKRFLSEQLPNWEQATAKMLLTALSHSDNEQVKESAELIKVSSKSQEMEILLDFAPSIEPLYNLFIMRQFLVSVNIR